MQFEQKVLTDVTNARAAAVSAGAQGVPAQAQAEGMLTGALRSLFAVVENYPELKANQNFLALQSELSNTEDRIQAARRFYNANVADYNRRVQQFPSRFIAGRFRFKEEEFFEIPEAERAVVGQAPRVDFGVGSAAGTSAAASPAPPAPGSAMPPPPPAGDGGTA